MPNYPEVYVFLTSDRSLFGISTEPDGHDLPKLRKRTWDAYDVIPFDLTHLAKYTDEPEQASGILLTGGYFLAKPAGNIVPFPGGKRKK